MPTSIAERSESGGDFGWARSVWATVAFGVAASILTWDPAFPPGPGLDASWVIGLHMAAGSGLDSGTEIVWTYGPLGFLDVPSTAGEATGALAGLYRLLLPAALASSLLWAASRSFALLAAAALAFAVTAITPVAVAPLSLAVVWALVALADGTPPWAARAVTIGGGAFAGLELLVKLNLGLSILLVVAITAVALGRPRGRNLAGAAISFAITAAVLWFASGQTIGNIDDFLRGSFEVVSGYSEALQLDGEHFAADVPLAILISAATLAFATWATRAAPRARRIGIGAIVVVCVYTLAKQGFVRHDYGHVDLFIGGIAAPWLALPAAGRERVAAAVGAVVIVLAAIPMAHHIRSSIEPKLAVTQLADLLEPGRRADARDRARAAMQASYGVDPAIIERIGGAPVDVRPWEVGLVWAYGLNWRPLPVIQDYEAYTPYLDRLNADALAGPDGPAYVLRHLAYGDGRQGIDGRYPPFDAPAETRTMLCGFRPLITSGFYELLGRTANRCGPPRPLGAVTIDYGEAVPVPSAGPREAVFATITGAGTDGLEALRAAAYRGAIRTIELDGTPYRLLPLTAQDGLLLSAPATSDFPAPFALAPGAAKIAVTSEGGLATSGGPVRIEFEAVPVSPAR